MKKFLALALSLLMVVAMVPFAFAIETPTASATAETGVFQTITPVIDGTIEEGWGTPFEVGTGFTKLQYDAYWASYDENNIYLAYRMVLTAGNTPSGYTCLLFDKNMDGTLTEATSSGAACEYLDWWNLSDTAAQWANDSTYENRFYSGGAINTEAVAAGTKVSQSATVRTEGDVTIIDHEVAIPYEALVVVGEKMKADEECVFTFKIYASMEGTTQRVLRVTKPAKAAEPTATYTVTWSGANECSVGDTLALNLNVAGEQFNASEITVTYDANYLTFVGITGYETSPNVKADVPGTIKIADFGVDLSNYVFNFTAEADVDATAITVTAASFGQAETADTSDLEDADISDAAWNVKINKKAYNVTYSIPDGMELAQIFSGTQTSVNEGESFTFTALQSALYTYTVTAEGATLTNEGDAYTIANPTAPVTVTVTMVAKQFDITTTQKQIDEEGNPTGEADVVNTVQGTYGTDYTFTLPTNIDPSENNGWKGHYYTLKSVSVEYTVDNGTYTIKGTDITAPITIEIEDKVVTKAQYTVTVDGTGAGQATASATTIVAGEADLTVTLTPNAAYDYEVSFKIGENDVAFTKEGNVYTVENEAITGNLTVNVTRTLKVTANAATFTAAGQNANFYLVTVQKVEGVDYTAQGYTYDGNAMYLTTVNDVEVFAYLVKGDADFALDETKVALASGAPVAITGTLDANGTGKTDANDAQFVYNLYQGKYEDFSETNTVAKLLAADNNEDGVISVLDAQAIVSEILK